MSSSDEFSGIFDNIKPEDFVRETSARQITKVKERLSMDFDNFVDKHLDMVRFGFHAADGTPNPVAVLIGRNSGHRIFSPDDDESLGDYVERLKREKKDATHFFIFNLTQGLAFYEDDPTEGPVDSKHVAEAAEKHGGMRPCLYWYAEGPGQIRSGIMTIEDGNTGDVIEAEPEHASPVYKAVLNKQ